jgi:hypothetical protein
MNKFSGIDLHSNNSVAVVSDERATVLPAPRRTATVRSPRRLRSTGPCVLTAAGARS